MIYCALLKNVVTIDNYKFKWLIYLSKTLLCSAGSSMNWRHLIRKDSELINESTDKTDVRTSPTEKLTK